MSAKIIPFKTAQPSAQQVEQVLDHLVNQELVQFGVDLSIARGLWKRYPALVEADTFPEPYATAFREQGDEPEDQDPDEAPSIAELRKRMLSEARELAQLWMRRGQLA